MGNTNTKDKHILSNYNNELELEEYITEMDKKYKLIGGYWYKLVILEGSGEITDEQRFHLLYIRCREEKRKEINKYKTTNEYMIKL
jgi:hypothetical protein